MDGLRYKPGQDRTRGPFAPHHTRLRLFAAAAGLHSTAPSSLRKFATVQDLLAEQGPAYDINLRVFYDLQRTITGWPGEGAACLRGALRRPAGWVLRRGVKGCRSASTAVAGMRCGVVAGVLVCTSPQPPRPMPPRSGGKPPGHKRTSHSSAHHKRHDAPAGTGAGVAGSAAAAGKAATRGGGGPCQQQRAGGRDQGTQGG